MKNTFTLITAVLDAKWNSTFPFIRFSETSFADGYDDFRLMSQTNGIQANQGSTLRPFVVKAAPPTEVKSATTNPGLTVQSVFKLTLTTDSTGKTIRMKNRAGALPFYQHLHQLKKEMECGNWRGRAAEIVPPREAVMYACPG